MYIFIFWYCNSKAVKCRIYNSTFWTFSSKWRWCQYPDATSCNSWTFLPATKKNHIIQTLYKVKLLISSYRDHFSYPGTDLIKKKLYIFIYKLYISLYIYSLISWASLLKLETRTQISDRKWKHSWIIF